MKLSKCVWGKMEIRKSKIERKELTQKTQKKSGLRKMRSSQAEFAEKRAATRRGGRASI
jgi:hypothetical protein